jgi:hypothetical protein
MTGQVIAAPVNPKINVTLNTPRLTDPVCPPLSIPQPEDGTTYPGSLLAVGLGLEIATDDQVCLERCGTHLRMHLYALSRALNPDLRVYDIHLLSPGDQRPQHRLGDQQSQNRPAAVDLGHLRAVAVPIHRQGAEDAAERLPGRDRTDRQTPVPRVGGGLWRAPALAVSKREQQRPPKVGVSLDRPRSPLLRRHRLSGRLQQ